jgi:hypothetical protein
LDPLPADYDPQKKEQLQKKGEQLYFILESLDIENPMTFAEFLTMLEIKDEGQYLMVLRSLLERQAIFHKRLLQHRFVNAFNVYMLS